MIKVTLEVIPHGDVSKTYVAGRLIIINGGTGTEETGHYDYRLSGPVKDGDGAAQMDELWMRGRLEHFPRAVGLWSCVKAVLNKENTDYDI